jgi:hypothetical protein
MDGDPDWPVSGGLYNANDKLIFPVGEKPSWLPCAAS